MKSSIRKPDFFETIADTNSLKDLQISSSQILRSIEALKAQNIDVNPNNIAIELGIPRAFLYADIETLELIYRNNAQQIGADKVIDLLLREIKSYKRKIQRLKNQVNNAATDKEKIFNEGFAKGAAMNFTHSKPTPETDLKAWARGILFITEINPSEEEVKKAYRKMIGFLHPDVAGDKANELFLELQKAYKIMLS